MILQTYTMILGFITYIVVHLNIISVMLLLSSKNDDVLFNTNQVPNYSLLVH